MKTHTDNLKGRFTRSARGLVHCCFHLAITIQSPIFDKFLRSKNPGSLLFQAAPDPVSLLTLDH